MENFANIEVEDVRQSSGYAKYMERIGWKVVHGVFIRKLGPVAIAKIQRVKMPVVWEKIDEILKRERVFMCKLEPVSGETPKGFRQDSWPMLGTKTLRVDLRPAENEIFKSFKKDCRYVLRKVQGARLKVQVNQFDRFYEIWQESAGRKHLWIPRKKEYQPLVESFRKKCFCICAGGEAGALILLHKNAAFYYYAGSTTEGSRLNLPYLVVWEAIREAKKRGAKIWDFEGVYDPRWPNKGWQGFSHFKKSFGGVEVEYPGCFVRWQWPF